MSSHRVLKAVPQQAVRAVHIWDVENMLEGVVTERRIRTLWVNYQTRVPVQVGDQFVVGCCRTYAPYVLFTMHAHARVVIGGNGHDAADIALLNAIDGAYIGRRFARVFLGSSDRIFGGLVKDLQSAGCEVTNVIGGHTQTRLYQQLCGDPMRFAEDSYPVATVA